MDSGDLMPVVSVALAAARGNGGGFFDWAKLDRQKIRPSISLRGFGGRLSAYYEDSRRTERDHPGLPTTGTLNQSQFSIPDSRSVMDPDVPDSHSKVQAYGLDGVLPLFSWLELSGAMRNTRSNAYQAAQYVSSNSPDFAPLLPSTWLRLAGTYAQRTQESQWRGRLTARYDDEVFGKAMGWISYGGDDGPDYAALEEGLANPIDLAHPTYGQWTGALLPFQEANSHFHIRNTGTGLQYRYGGWLNTYVALTRSRAQVDNYQTTITAQLLRETLGQQAADLIEPIIERLEQSALLAGTGLLVRRSDQYNLVSRQYGVAVRPWDAGSDVEDDGLWLFYGKGNGHQFQAYFVSGSQPKPELSDQREYGIRLINRDWGRLEAARFIINRRNAPAIDPNSITGFDYVTTGLQSVHGYDLDLHLNPPYEFWDRFTLNGSAAWLRGRLEQDNTYPAGNRLDNVPAVRWRLQLAADVIQTGLPLRVFLTRRCQSQVAGDLSNSFTVPGRCLLDTGATAQWRDFTLDAVVNNVTNVHYYEPYTYLFYGVIPGEAINARISLSYRFGASE